MQKKNSKKKNYIYMNVVFLTLCIYVILFPIIIIPIKALVPAFGICPYLRITGNFCPLCGGTRYIAGLFQAFRTPSYLISPFGAIVVFILIEVIFRICILLKKSYSKKIMFFDFIYHLVIGILFIGYEILFFVV